MESSDLSLSMPMLSFTPVFLIGTSYLLLHEVPSAAGVAGICIIVSGSYVLNISAEHEHFLDPVRSMVQNRGSWYMLIVAFLFAASVNYDKIAMLNSDPVFGMAFTLLIIGGAFAVIVVFSRKSAGPIFRCPLPGTGSFRPSPETAVPSAYLVPAILAASSSRQSASRSILPIRSRSRRT